MAPSPGCQQQQQRKHHLRTPWDVIASMHAGPPPPTVEPSEAPFASDPSSTGTVSADPSLVDLVVSSDQGTQCDADPGLTAIRTALLQAAQQPRAAQRQRIQDASAELLRRVLPPAPGGAAASACTCAAAAALTRAVELLCEATVENERRSNARWAPRPKPAATSNYPDPPSPVLLAPGAFRRQSALSVLTGGGSVSGDELSGSLLRNPTQVTMEAAVGDEEDDGTRTINQYVLLDKIGSGAQGEVHLAMDTEQNEMRAVKVVKRSNAGSGFKAARRERERLQLEREVAIMKRCRHRNVVALYEVIDDPEQHAMYLVMQYVEHGPLVKLSPTGVADRRVAPGKLIQYARQIVAGLLYLHEHGVVHRDIKPDNILLGANDAVYLADFGMSELFAMDDADKSIVGDASSPLASPGGGKISGTKGTMAFVAPELLSATQSQGTAGEAVDVWALGLTFYVLLYGKLPWHFESFTDLVDRILDAPVPFDEDDDGVLLAAGGPTAPPVGKDPFCLDPSDDDDDAPRASFPTAVVGAGAPCTAHVLQRLKRLIRAMLHRDAAQRVTLKRANRELRSITALLDEELTAAAAGAATSATLQPAVVARVHRRVSLAACEAIRRRASVQVGAVALVPTTAARRQSCLVHVVPEPLPFPDMAGVAAASESMALTGSMSPTCNQLDETHSGLSISEGALDGDRTVSPETRPVLRMPVPPPRATTPPDRFPRVSFL